MQQVQGCSAGGAAAAPILHSKQQRLRVLQRACNNGGLYGRHAHAEPGAPAAAAPAPSLSVTLSLQVQQFLQERGYTAALEALTRESKHEMSIEGGGGQLCSILAEYEDMKMLEVTQEVLPAAALPCLCVLRLTLRGAGG